MCKNFMPRAALVEVEVGATSSTASLTTIVRQTVMLVSCMVRELQEQYEDLETLPFHPRVRLQIALEEQYEAEDFSRQDLQIYALPIL